MIEEQLIALVYVNQYIYIRGFGDVASKGNCINFQQNISTITDILPRLPSELPIILIQKKDSALNNTDFIVRRNVIELWLKFLKQNSKCTNYRNINISTERLNLLPENDILPDLKIYETDENINMDNFGASIQNHSYGDETSFELLNDTLHNESTNSGVFNPLNEIQTEKSQLKTFIEQFNNKI